MQIRAYRIAILVFAGRTGSKNAWRVEFAVHGIGLASIDHEEDLSVSVRTSNWYMAISRLESGSPTSSGCASAETHLRCRKLRSPLDPGT